VQPTAAQVSRWITERSRRFKSQKETVEAIRRARRLTWTVNVPKRLEQVTGLTGYVYRDAAIADESLSLPTLYTSKLPDVTVSSDGRGDTSPLTTRIEAFTKAALFRDCGCRAEGPPTHERLFDGVFEGAAWTKLVKDPAGIWSDYVATARAGPDATREDGRPRYEDDPTEPEREDDEDDESYTKKKATYKPRSKYKKYRDATENAKKKAGVPIRWDFVDCLNLLPGYEGDVLVDMIEIQTRDISFLREHHLGMSSDGKIVPADTAVLDWETRCDGNATVDLVQYWDKTDQAFFLRYSGGFRGAEAGYGGALEPLKGYCRPHGYKLGRPPYWASFGSTMNFEYGRVATWAAYETKRPAVEYLSFLRTIRAYLGIRDAMPPLAETTPEGVAPGEDPEAPSGPEVYEAGMKYKLRPGQKLEPVALPDTTATLQQEIASTAADLANRGPTRVTGSLEGAGTAMATAFERDRAKYNQHEASIVKHLRDVALALWTLVAGLDEPVYVRGGTGVLLKVSPDDFDHALDPEWTLHVDSMASDMVREQYLSRRVQNGTLGVSQSIERQGDNTNEVFQAIAEQNVRTSETYAKALEAEVLSHWGRGEWSELQNQAETLAQSGQQQAGPPPEQGGMGVAVPAGAMGQTDAGVSMGGMPQPGVPPGVPPGTPAAPSVSMAPAGAAAMGVHGGVPG
jgi:hypothetical protein